MEADFWTKILDLKRIEYNNENLEEKILCIKNLFTKEKKHRYDV